MAISPDKAVFYSAVITLSSTTAVAVLPGKYGGRGELPTARMLIGTSISFMALGIIADIAPGVGVPLAMSVAVTAFMYYGVPVMENYFTPAANKTEAKIRTSQVAGPAST